MAHLTWYKLTQQLRQPKIAVECENQFGRQEMLLGNSVALLVPTEKVEEGGKAPVGLDHFKVYEVVDVAVAIERRVVSLKDQFGSQNGAEIQKIRYFCVPVAKQHADSVSKLSNRLGHLAIYSALPATDYGKTQDTIDQFGKHNLSINQTQMLAVPTVKIAWKAIGG